jgi:hypothetical protein
MVSQQDEGAKHINSWGRTDSIVNLLGTAVSKHVCLLLHEHNTSFRMENTEREYKGTGSHFLMSSYLAPSPPASARTRKITGVPQRE